MAFTPAQLTLLYWLTIVILIIKGTVLTYMLLKINQKRKEESLKITDFYVGVTILTAALLISRLFYFYFDFYLTGYNTALYLVGSNLWFWRIGATILGLGGAYLIFIVDRQVLKLKGILGIIVAGLAIVLVFYPVNTLDDFVILSAIGLATALVFVIIPIVFIWIGIKRPDSRGVALSIAIGALFYGIGGVLISESTLGPLEGLYGPDIRTFIIIFSVILKMIGVCIVSFGASKLKI